MANRLPLVQNAGQFSQLKSPDLLVDTDGHGYVDAAAAFGTDDVLVASDGTARGVKATAIDKDNVVTAANNFGTNDRVIVSDGTAKAVEASSLLITDVATLSTRWLVQTATKTGGYTAAVNDLVVCDCSGGSFTVTLPTPSVDDEVGVLLLADTVPNTVTIDSDGGSILGKNGSQGDTIDLYIENDYVRLKYRGSNVWQIVDDERTLHYAEMRGDATTGQTINHNTTTVLDFATEVADNAGLADTSTDEITIRRAGRYSVYAAAGVASGAVLQVWSLNIRKNGSNIRGAQQIPAAFSSNIVNNISSNADLAAGDVITVSVVQQSSDSSSKTILLTEAATSRIVVQEIR